MGYAKTMALRKLRGEIRDRRLRATGKELPESGACIACDRSSNKPIEFMPDGQHP